MPITFPYLLENGKELRLNITVSQNSVVALEAWGVKIVEENLKKERVKIDK